MTYYPERIEIIWDLKINVTNEVISVTDKVTKKLHFSQYEDLAQTPHLQSKTFHVLKTQTNWHCFVLNTYTVCYKTWVQENSESFAHFWLQLTGFCISQVICKMKFKYDTRLLQLQPREQLKTWRRVCDGVNGDMTSIWSLLWNNWRSQWRIKPSGQQPMVYEASQFCNHPMYSDRQRLSKQ